MAADESEVAGVGDGAEQTAPDDGGDVAGRDPDEIEREIEQTRAELADTIDAIADRISPKRAASRGAQAVKAQVSAAKSAVGGDSTPIPPALNGSPAEPSPATSAPVSASPPVVPLIAAAAFAVAVLVFFRRRRSR